MSVPADDALARTVIKMDDKAAEERQRLKQQILAAAADQEGASNPRIFSITQQPAVERDDNGRGKAAGGNYNAAKPGPAPRRR